MLSDKDGVVDVGLVILGDRGAGGIGGDVGKEDENAGCDTEEGIEVCPFEEGLLPPPNIALSPP